MQNAEIKEKDSHNFFDKNSLTSFAAINKSQLTVSDYYLERHSNQWVALFDTQFWPLKSVQD